MEFTDEELNTLNIAFSECHYFHENCVGLDCSECKHTLMKNKITAELEKREGE